MNFIRLSLFLYVALLTLVCNSDSRQCFTDDLLTGTQQSNGTIPDLLTPGSYQIIARYPHDTSAFTQGLVFYKDNLFESTGLLDKSGVRKVNFNSGKVLLKTQLPDIYFGEGLVLLNNQLIQMSWKSGKVFFFQPETLKLIKRQRIEKNVWGSTVINGNLLLSDGSSNLFFIDSENLSINKTLKITINNKELSGLNELEYVKGYVYANVWPTSCVVKIDPVSGNVVDWFDLSKLYPTDYQLSDSAVLNGIAYHKQKNHFFVTGKFWLYLYEINLQFNDD